MLIARPEGRAEFLLLVAIETDPNRSRNRPALLSQSDAHQMLAHLAADLEALMPEIRKCRLASVGALFDQSQVLRPATPLFTALSAALPTRPGASPGGKDAPGLHGIGTRDGAMPSAALEPDSSIPTGILQLLPIVAEGPADLIERLSEEMEHRFLAEGQLSAHSASWLEAAFAIGVGHARFMTLTDLNAMFRMQLDHFGYLPLWELIDAAVSGASAELKVETRAGAAFTWRDGRVRVHFQTFDHWSNDGPGRDIETAGDALVGGYGEWSRDLRRYTTTLRAHGVALQFELPAGSRGRVEEAYLYEEAPAPGNNGLFASVTEHSCPELGVVAVTATTEAAMRHYYPLRPRGLNEIHETVQRLELSGEGVAFPGRIEYDPETRRLRPAAFE